MAAPHHTSHHAEPDTKSHPCRVCGTTSHASGNQGNGRICRGCWYKIGIILLIVMVIASYVVWIGLL